MTDHSHAMAAQRGEFPVLETSEIVMGLCWAPPPHEAAAARAPANLDALCVLTGAAGEVIELVHPGATQNANGSVLHTGDSPSGASRWDDERIFVFLDAVPESVRQIVFGVVSASGHAFGDVEGARCHVSDHRNDVELIAHDLTALGDATRHCVAALRRGTAGWVLGPCAAADEIERAVRAGRRPPAAITASDC
jgi:stress response protein SCP2